MMGFREDVEIVSHMLPLLPRNKKKKHSTIMKVDKKRKVGLGWIGLGSPPIKLLVEHLIYISHEQGGGDDRRG